MRLPCQRPRPHQLSSTVNLQRCTHRRQHQTRSAAVMFVWMFLLRAACLLPEDHFPPFPTLHPLLSPSLVVKPHLHFISDAFIFLLPECFSFHLSVLFVLKYAELECIKTSDADECFCKFTPPNPLPQPSPPCWNPQIYCKADDFLLGITWELFNSTISSLLLFLLPLPSTACLPLYHLSIL